MKNSILKIVSIAGVWMMGGVLNSMAIEEAAYRVVSESGRFEIRDYEPHLVAQVEVDGSLEDAGSRAFRSLFNYIDGENRSRQKIEMTAPVSQSSAGEKIAMTAPVSQEKSGDRWLVSFMMPAKYSMQTIPEPADPSIVLREYPARRFAVVRYSGTWSEKNYQRNLAKLRTWLEEQGIEPEGEPVWARYNAPFVPWFLRRNEIMIPLRQP